MRQIKFRVWSNVKKQWISNACLVAAIDGLPFVHFVETDENKQFVKHHIYNASSLNPVIQQFTGLLDKNGKEIYEGDIVQEGISKCEVLWGVSGWDPFEYCGGGELNSNQCEIIGNIYENPELLNNK